MNIDHPFNQCMLSEVPEARLAYEFWETGMNTEPTIDIALFAVYTEWLNETCYAELLAKG